MHAGAAAPGVGAAPGSWLQLKVTLKDTAPPVWRRLVVPASTKLDQLHEFIQAAFGWWNYHLYEFQIGRKLYGVPDPDWDLDFGPRVTPSRSVALSKVAAVGSSFNYSYDFGDGWEHKVTVEKSLPQPPTSPVATAPRWKARRRGSRRARDPVNRDGLGAAGRAGTTTGRR